MLLARTKCDIHLFNTSNIVYNLHFQNGSCSKLISSIFCFIDSNESLSIVFNDSIRFDNVTAALCCFDRVVANNFCCHILQSSWNSHWIR